MNEIVPPEDFLEELIANGLLEKFLMLPLEDRVAFIEWINSAKKEDSRISRIQRTIEKIENS